MMIHLALDDLPDWRAGEALRRFAYVHVAPDLEMMARVYAEASAGLLPAEPALVVGQPTAIDPSRAPAASTCSGCRCACCRRKFAGDAKGEIRRASWDEAKDPMPSASGHPRSVTRRACGPRMLGRAVFSPLDLERENPNLIGGDNLSGSHHLDQNFFLRPVAGWSRYRTPVQATSISAAPRPGRARARARVRVLCSRKCWRGDLSVQSGTAACA